MTQQAAQAVENNFRNGLVTEATGLNFPESACTETYDCVFNFDGSVSRRRGFDFESDFSTKSINRASSVVTTYFWRNVTGASELSIVVLQVGATLYFYEVDTDGAIPTSQGAIAATISLTPVSGAPTPELIECQFASGNGLLFVTHPYCEPFYVSYTPSTQTPAKTDIIIKVRDFEGDTTDSLGIDERPTANRTTLTPAHLYNLYNQSWNRASLVSWDARNDMPSNADVMWFFKNAGGGFDISNVGDIDTGNSPAPKGHYIFPLSATTRNTSVSADDQTTQTTVTETTTGFYRPATCAFFAGRVFYAGVQALGFNSNIYFSQIVEKPDQYGKCYQKNDPTSENAFDLLPDDGGVIRIPEADTIIKMFVVPGGLLVFARRGVWLITGSTGIGFTATDYTVLKISSIATLSHTSFVDVLGVPYWWVAEGIYTINSDGNGAPTVKSITYERIKQFYDAIPLNSKTTAKGIFNYITNVVQWIFKSEVVGVPDQDYQYDRILNFNTSTNAFYPWTIPDSAVTINSILLLDGGTGSLTVSNVVDDSANLVIDDSSNQVIAFSATNEGDIPQITYLVSYPDSGSYKFTFGSSRSSDYIDWFQYDDTGTEYNSYFVSGYKLRGGAIRKWQANWLRMFSKGLLETRFNIRGLWDFASSAGTGRWNNPQLIINNATDYANLSKRIKMRGHGLTLQFKVESVDSYPFELIGWAEYSTGNTIP